MNVLFPLTSQKDFLNNELILVLVTFVGRLISLVRVCGRGAVWDETCEYVETIVVAIVVIIIAGCVALAKEECIKRHDKVCTQVHFNIYK